MANGIQHLNPDELLKSPAFSQVIVTEGKTIYIGGQDAVAANGELVGKGDRATPTIQWKLMPLPSCLRNKNRPGAGFNRRGAGFSKPAPCGK